MGKDAIKRDAVSSISASANASPATNGVSGQQSASEQSVYYPPTSCYDYYYSGYNGTYAPSDDKAYYNTAGGPYPGIQSDNTSLLYYIPGYGYPSGYMGVDGKQSYASSDYLQQPCSYGLDGFSCYTYDSAYASKGSAGAAKSASVKSMMGPSGSGRSSGLNTSKPNNSLSNNISALPFNSKVPPAASNFSKSIYQNQSLKSLNKFASGYQSAGLMKGYQPAGKFSSYVSRNPGFHMQYGPLNYQTGGRVWNNDYRYKSRESYGRNGQNEDLTELTRGPRGDQNRNNSSNVSAEVEQHVLPVERTKYNLPEFQTEYENAKFYVIKSYSEDDVHKSIKYDVWSSTPNGNKKLDAAFGEANAKTTETGIKCPVFLFFSVNGSGQFMGVAEMVGPVDFSRNMDFWQLDKWNGCFPIKWHIIKDVPNTLLRHISLENNENKPVTYTRDTQEIFLKQGLEMLSIFKNYSEKASILDDFNFYENREKSLKAKRNAKQASQTNGVKNDGLEKHFEAGEGKVADQAMKASSVDAASSLISLTKNLSLTSQSLKGST